MDFLFLSCVQFSPSKPGHSGTRGHEFPFSSGNQKNSHGARKYVPHCATCTRRAYVGEEAHSTTPARSMDTQVSQQILPCVRANRCTLVARFEDRCRSGKDEEHGSSGECHKHGRRPTRLVIDHHTPAAMLASSIASHWCRGGHVGPDAGTSASFLRVASVEASRAGPGCVLFWNVGICNRYFSAGILDATIK